jgi:hypothetical protein
MSNIVDTRFSLFDLSKDEKMTCESLTQVDGTSITVMPTHHINDLGSFTGFRFECVNATRGDLLPISRHMFHGTTMVECNIPEGDILQLMLNLTRNREKMYHFLQKVESDCVQATLNCIPENQGVLANPGLCTVDSMNWSAELPDRIGIYHSYTRGNSRDVRSHKLFLVCTGGLMKASDEFCNLLIDIGQQCTALEVCQSEETWWLRKACQRARCRLLKLLADAFEIPVPYLSDMQSYGTHQVVIPTTDTVFHDIMPMSNNKIGIYNTCVDTTKNMNGILCNMHPSEGVWLFKGAYRGQGYGSMFGTQDVCGVFPVNAPSIKRPQSISTVDSTCVVRLREPKEKRGYYMNFDENYFKVLENMQWNRDNGYEILMPIIVGMP